MPRIVAQPKPQQPVEVVESKEDKLVRLAGKRVEKACKAISLLGNLSTYRPTTADVDAIMSALGETCSAVENRLRGAKKHSYVFALRQVPASH
jgi:hypothetical protein